MQARKLTDYRARLAAMAAGLDDDDALGAEGRQVVELDQCAVGRLSRMDALQGQAMARATQARRAATRRRIAAALVRLDEDEFGYCTECGDEIEQRRLDLDPTTPTCISCARG
jgi:RNA polymerase-binding transcription factor